MNILVVSNKCPPDYDGGYELRAFQIANALRERGHDVQMATSFLRAGFELNEPEPDWVHRIFRYVPISSATGIVRKMDRAWRRILCTKIASHNVPAMHAFLDGRRFDIAYCFGMHRISLASAVPISERKIPLMWHAGGTYLADQLCHWPKTVPGFDLGLKLLAGSWWEMEKRVDVTNIAFVSDFLRREFARRGMCPAHSYIISRGAEFPLQRDVDRSRTEPPVLFMASRLDKEKGIDRALWAAAELLKLAPELKWKLVIAGAPGNRAYRLELDRIVRDQGLASRVEFVGKLTRNEVLCGMRDATAFLSCSIYGEPFAGTIIETLASGTPLLGSKDGSIEEVVRHGESALLHDRLDSWGLAENMRRILTDPALARKLAENGLDVIANRYTLDKILGQTESVFAEVIANSRSSAGGQK